MWVFAWHNLISRPSRTVLAVVGLTIPVLAFLGLFSISQGIRDLMGSTLERMQGMMILRENSPSPVFSDLPAALGDTLRKIPGVRVVAPEVWRIAPPINGKGSVFGMALGLLGRSREEGIGNLSKMVQIEGQDLPEHLKLRSALFALSLLPKDKGGGRFLNLGDIGKPNIVISAKIARDYPNTDGTPKAVGQTLAIGGKTFTIVGIYSTDSFITDMTIVMEIGVARKLLGIGEDSVSTYDIEANNIAETDALIERVEAAAPGIHAQRISQFNVTVGSVMEKLEIFLLLAVALATLVGGVGIANTMLMSTSERYVEFGVMRANGWTKRNILALVTTESALLGLLSGVLGGICAGAAVVAVNHFVTGFTLNMRPWLVAVSLAGALLIAMVSGLYPAWRASRMTPMDAIRHSGMT